MVIMEEGISLGSSRNPPCNAWDVGLIPGWENKILQAAWSGKKKSVWGRQSVFYFLSYVALTEAGDIWGWGSGRLSSPIPGRQQEVGYTRAELRALCVFHCPFRPHLKNTNSKIKL